MEISRAIEIPGYMDALELQWLASQAAEHSVIVELGSYLGRSTRALGDNAKGVVYAVDNWEGPVGLNDINLDPSEGQYERFCKNLEDLIRDGVVIPVRSNHREVQIPGSFDMVFLDGNHTAEYVKADIRKWLPTIQPGGIISGHDAMWPGLIEAVWDELGYVEMAANLSIWWKLKK